MTQITFNLPDELILRLGSLTSQIPQILELGLRELNASSQTEFEGSADILEFLASLPSPEEILNLRPSQTLQNKINTLLYKNNSGGLNPEEEKQWEQYQYLEHLVRIAKAKAYIKIKQTES